MVDTLFEQVVPAQLNAVSSLRRATNEFLQSAEDQFRSAVLLVVSELSTNAVEALHDLNAEFRLRVHDFDDRVEIEVIDAGPGFAGALGRPGSDESNPRGRGLQVVHALVDEFHVHRRDGVTTVCCKMFRSRPNQ